MNYEFGHALSRLTAGILPGHVQVGAQTDADDERAENQLALITDQEGLLDEGDLHSDRKHLIISHLLQISQRVIATSGEPHEAEKGRTPIQFFGVLNRRNGDSFRAQADPRIFLCIEVGWKEWLIGGIGVVMLGEAT